MERQRLYQHLNTGLLGGGQLILISAPAGFGKTTCAAAWLETLDLPAAWLTLDPVDDDPARFLAYLTAALRQIDENIGWEIDAVLRSGQVPPSETASTVLLNDTLQVEQPFVLVLDDFHALQDAAVLAIMERLVTHHPPHMHLVLITREDPTLPLARLRANNQLTELRAADLRFTQDEIRQFLAANLTAALGEAEIALLDRKTEGWAEGLLLATLAVDQHDDPARFAADLSGTHRHILNYLTEEVLDQQSPPVRRFLLQTSVLDRLNGGLWDAETVREDSHTLLETLHSANLFLFPLDDAHQWYRYHHLFGDLLRGLQQHHHADEARTLHQRASDWYAEAAMITEGIRHAVLAGDRARSLTLIEAHAMDRLMQWDIKTVEDWMTMLPAEWRFSTPKMGAIEARMQIFRGDYAQAAAVVERIAGHMVDTEPALQADWLAIQAALSHIQGEPARALQLAEQAFELAEDANVRSLIGLARAGAYQQFQEREGAVQAYQQIIADGRAAGSLVAELLGLSGLGLLAMHHGQLHFAFELATQGADRLEHAGILPPISTGIYGELAQIHYEWNQIEEAHHYFRRAARASHLSGYEDAALYYLVIQSRLALREGDTAAASEAVSAAIERMQPVSPIAVREEVIGQQVRVFLEEGRLADAEHSLRRVGIVPGADLATPEQPSAADTTHPTAVLLNSALRLMLHRADGQDLQIAVRMADQLFAALLKGQYLAAVLETLFVRAQIHSALGDDLAALQDYRQAITLAEPEGFVSNFVDAGQPVSAGLRELLTSDAGSGEYIRRILAAFAEPEQTETTLADPLTEREIDVLHLMADGLTYQQIADQLVISLNTVRFYVKEIYSKLHVHNRTHALEAARRLNLI
ncbi:MAG: LuxR C-terminal-related transcriptional regulator [Anaerolineae bacterium]